MPSKPQRSWVEISASALRGNLHSFQGMLGSGPKIMPIIKANAYGHDMAIVASTLAKSQIWGFGVAYSAEALALRTAGIHRRILVLSAWQADDLRDCLRQKIELVAWDFSSLTTIDSLAAKLRTKALVHVKIDTGTSRIGFLPSELPRLASVLSKLQHIRVRGVFSHLANAEEGASTRTQEQLKRFATLIGLVPMDREGEAHIACTAAAIRYPDSRYAAIRLGIGLYGLWPSPSIEHFATSRRRMLHLRPVLTWKTRILQVKTVPAGSSIGYGSTVTVRRATRIATLPVGYADGYRRSWSNRAPVIVRDRRAPVIGRVCMNLTMINCQAIPQAQPGDEVTLMGPGIPADELAKLDQTINYDIVTGINPILPRILV